MKEDKSKLVEVFRGSLWKAELLKTILSDHGIESATKDSLVVNLAMPSNVVDVFVLVNESDKEEATRIVAEFEKNE